MTNFFYLFRLSVLFVAVLLSATLLSDKLSAATDESEVFQQVSVAEPFIEFHTGPGRGYPVFHVVEKGETISLIKKKTQWYKVEATKGISGWVHQDKMQLTLTEKGENYQSEIIGEKDYLKRVFGAGVLAGEFGGANVMTLFTNWNFTSNLGAELNYSQAIGNVSDIQFLTANIHHQVFPEWLVSPYVKIGAGIIQTSPHSTIVLTEDRKDRLLYSGAGVRVYISQQFIFRAEYNSYTILTSRNDNDEVEEWKIGFSAFF